MILAASTKDYPAILELWELSVRATHHFLQEDYLQEIKVILPSILPKMPIYIWMGEEGMIKGFTGVADRKIEMLFIHPASRGQGIGRLLTEFCIRICKANKADVNEQNEEAIGFYKKIGFKITGRQELDSMERPYPLLQMEYFEGV